MLARLAVDQQRQGKRYGLWLLMDAIKRCALVGQQSGVYALVVDAKDNEAKHFYLRYGFIAIVSRPMMLYLPCTRCDQPRALDPGARDARNQPMVGNWTTCQ